MIPNDVSRAVARNIVPAAICTTGLAVGFGIAVTLLAAMDSALRGAFPYGRPEQLFLVDYAGPTGTARRLSIEQLEMIRQESTDASSVGAYWDSSQVALEGEFAGPVQAALLEPELLRLLDVTPVVGRLPTDSGDAECVIGENVWSSRFNRSQQLLGASLTFTDGRCTLVGVIPAAFFFPDPQTRMWLPLPRAAHRPEARGQPNLMVVARLPTEAARAALLTKLQTLSMGTDSSPQPRIRSLAGVVTQDYRQALTGLLVAIGAVLILSTINLASFINAISVDRRREVSIRLALGASRLSIAAMVTRFAMIVAAPSALGGLLLAQVMLNLLKSLELPDLWWLQSVSITWPIVAALLVTTVLVAVVAAASAFSFVMSNSVLGELIRPSGPFVKVTGGRVLWPVAVQLACATSTAVFASVCIQSYFGALKASWGFDPSNLLVVETELPRDDQGPEARTLLIEGALRNLRSSNAFEVVAMGQGIPLRWKGWEITKARFRFDDAPIDVGLWKISSDYFRALGVPLVAGREFSDAAPTENSVILSAAAANQLCLNQCVGEHIEILTGVAGDPSKPKRADRIRWVPYGSRSRVVVGVVDNFKVFGLEAESRPAIFLHHAAQPMSGGARLRPTFLLRLSPAAAASARKTIVHALQSSNAQTRLVDIVSMDSLISQALGVFGSRKLLAAAGSVTSGLAILVAISGIFAASTAMAVQRIRDIAIRLAIGGGPARVFLSVAGSVLRSAILGMGIGLISATVAVMYTRSLLFGPTSTKVATGVAALLLLCVCTVAIVGIAFVVPTRRRALMRVLNE